MSRRCHCRAVPRPSFLLGNGAHLPLILTFPLMFIPVHPCAYGMVLLCPGLTPADSPSQPRRCTKLNPWGLTTCLCRQYSLTVLGFTFKFAASAPGAKSIFVIILMVCRPNGSHLQPACSIGQLARSSSVAHTARMMFNLWIHCACTGPQSSGVHVVIIYHTLLIAVK